MGDLYEIMDFICFMMGSFFDVLDNVFLGGHSFLDIQIALAFFSMTIWFIMRVMDNKEGESGDV